MKKEAVRPVGQRVTGGRLFSPFAMLVFIAAIGMLTFPAELYRGDAAGVREETRSILSGRGLEIPPDLVAASGTAPGQLFVRNDQSGKWYSKYGVFSSIFYLPPLIAERVITGEMPAFGSGPRLVILNIYHLLVALGLGWLLYQFCGLYVQEPGARILYVLGCFYCTYLWNYLRAQITETFQIILFTSFMYFTIKWWRLPARGRSSQRFLWFALTAWGALSLTKLSFLPLCLVPLGVCLRLSWQEGRRRLALVRSPWVLSVFAGVAVVFGVMGAIHWVKFGAPWLSGYHQWSYDNHLFSGSFLRGLYGYLFHPHGSIFTHFPLLLIAFMGARAFHRRYAAELWLLLGILTVYLLLFSTLGNWKGELCYGPRYLVFILPLAAAPALFTIEKLMLAPRSHAKTAGALACAALLVYSSLQQAYVNQLHFFSYYEFFAPYQASGDREIEDYFQKRSFAQVNSDIIRSEDHLEELPFSEMARHRYGERKWQEFKISAESALRHSNYYWLVKAGQ